MPLFFQDVPAGFVIGKCRILIKTWHFFGVFFGGISHILPHRLVWKFKDSLRGVLSLYWTDVHFFCSFLGKITDGKIQNMLCLSFWRTKMWRIFTVNMWRTMWRFFTSTVLLGNWRKMCIYLGFFSHRWACFLYEKGSFSCWWGELSRESRVFF